MNYVGDKIKRNFFVTLVAYVSISIITVFTAMIIIGTFFNDSGITNEKLFVIAAVFWLCIFVL